MTPRTAPHLRRTTGDDPAFQALVAELDADLAIRDGAEHGFFAQFNGSHDLGHAIVAFVDGAPAGIGAFRELAPGDVELKRMFVTPAHRGRGVARAVLAALEAWAVERGATAARLETGVRQPEAIALYRACGYQPIPNYPPYVGVASSVCFAKALGPRPTADRSSPA